MLTVVPAPADRLSEARALLLLVEAWRPALWVVGWLVLPLLGVGLLVGGCEWAGGLLTGAAVSLALSRYGPRRWPGRR